MLDPALQDHLDQGEWLKDLFDNAHDLIQIVHPDSTILYINQSWSVLLGYNMEEIQGRSIYEFISEEDRERYRVHRDKALQQDPSPAGLKFQLKKKNGEIAFVEGIVSAKFNEGRPIYTRGIFRDVTVQHHNELQLIQLNAELREREYNVRQLVHNAPDAIIVIDRNSRIILWNPKAEMIFGWKEDEVLHRTLSETIIPVQHREAHERGMNRFLSTGVTTIMHKTVEITALNREGAEFHIALTVAPSQHAGGTSFIAFIRDISEQKNNQMDLYNKTIELERTNSNLEEFTYAASHDLKEPIRKMQIFSGRLKDRMASRLEEEDLRLFSRMENATERMRSLIDDLLTYSGVSNGIPEFTTVNLNREIALVLEDLELDIQDKGARIHLGILPTVNGHPRQLQQLFQNLIANSLKYSQPGVRPEITITSQLVKGKALPFTLSAEEQEKDFYLIKVRDNGIGFEQKYAEKIFNVFTRLYEENDKKGTGIGLSIVRKVAANHKGHIMAEGIPGAGACFSLLLPA